MKMDLKLKELEKNTYIGEISIGNRTFMYNLKYPNGIFSDARAEDYYKLILKDEDGKSIKTTKKIENYFAGSIGVVVSQLKYYSPAIGVVASRLQDFNPTLIKEYGALYDEEMVEMKEFDSLALLEQFVSTQEGRKKLEDIRKDLESLINNRKGGDKQTF